MSKISELVADLRDKLYQTTGADWELNIHWTLTEPVCPAASLRPEEEGMSDLMRYVAWGDTVEEAVELVVKAATAELLEGRFKDGTNAPWTNPADKQFFTWLAKARSRLTKDA